MFFGSFCFFCLHFCHPIGGRDSLKKRKIHKECGVVGISTMDILEFTAHKSTVQCGFSYLNALDWTVGALLYH